MTMTQKISAVGTLVAISAAWFSFAGFPPYASASDVKANTEIAKSALQQALENRADNQEQRVISYEIYIEDRGETSDRKRRLKELRAALKKYEESRDRAYK